MPNIASTSTHQSTILSSCLNTLDNTSEVRTVMHGDEGHIHKPMVNENNYNGKLLIRITKDGFLT